MRIAHDLSAGAGLEGVARRAATELRAAGEPVRSTGQGYGRERLTMQELTIARLVATGRPPPRWPGDCS